MNEGVNIRQQRFVNAYALEPNATKACIAAGYAKNGAGIQGCRLLKKDSIQAALIEAEQAQVAQQAMTVARFIHELSRLANSNMANYWRYDDDGTSQPIDILELSRDHAAAIQEYTRDSNGVIRIKLWPKLAASEQLGKWLGVFVDRHEVQIQVEAIDRRIIDVAGLEPAPDDAKAITNQQVIDDST